MLDALGDGVRRVLEQGRHHGQGPGHLELPDCSGPLEPCLEPQGRQPIDHALAQLVSNLTFRVAAAMSEEEHIHVLQQRRIQPAQALDEDADALPFSYLPEESQAADRGVLSRRLDGFPERHGLPEVLHHEHGLRQGPAVIAQPADEPFARADDCVRELNTRSLGDFLAETCDRVRHLSRGRREDSRGSVAVEDERGVRERPVELPRPQRRVRNRAPVVGNDNVRWIVAQRVVHVRGRRKELGPHRAVSR